MTPNEILELEISLILVKYGKESVLKALARRLDISENRLMVELESLKHENVLKNSRKSAVRAFNIDSIEINDKDKFDYLFKLDARFNNKTFLPELKDVKRFFDRHGRPSPTLKSRTAAQASLFRLLASMSINELQKLLAEKETCSESSLGLISDEILRRKF